MRLTIRMVETASCGIVPVLCDEYGKQLPCQRGGEIRWDIADAAVVRFEFVVDRESVSFATAGGEPSVHSAEDD